MKKIILIIAVLNLTLSSCEDFLTVNPQDATGADSYYVSEESLRANTASLYGFPWFDFHQALMWVAGDALAGDIYYTYDAGGQFYYNQVGAGNSFNGTGWEGLFRVVSYANSIINDMPSMANRNGIPENAINVALGEARFIRAVAYFFLTELWGEVPIIENSTALITSGNPQDIYVNKHTKSSIYRFICEDLEFAENHLPDKAFQPGRVTKWSAKGMLAKAYLTRAAYETSTKYYATAKTYAEDVIKNSGLTLWPDYTTLFDVEANNNSESLFAIQCMTGGYALGNARTVYWSRSSRIADDSWGGGVGPTLSLQSIYEDEKNNSRRKTVFMTQGDYYPNLNKANGGYTYQLTYRDPNNLDVTVENSNEVLANLKKYTIGKAADNGGKVGLNQDAGNNLYVLRLADVYMIYAEACIGTANFTNDATALGYINDVRRRSGIVDFPGSTITYEELLIERRKEFACEAINWYDIKRLYYKDHQAAFNYLANMKRDQIYRIDSTTDYWEDSTPTDRKYEIENDRKSYILSWQTVVAPDDPTSDRVNNIDFNDTSMFLQLPASVTTTAPVLNEPAVDYYANN